MKYLALNLVGLFIVFLLSAGNALGASAITKSKTSGPIAAKIAKANALIKADRNSEAVSLLKPISADLPRHGLLALAKAYHSQKNYLEETRILETILGQNDKDYYVENLLGECYLANHDLEKAADKFSEARELKSDYIPSYVGLEKTYEAKNQIDDAREVLNDMIHTFGLKKEFLNDLCRLSSLEGSIQEGISVCQRATSFDSKLPANHIYLGQMLIENDQADRGEMIIIKAAKQFQKSDIAQIAAANIKFKHKQWHEAADFFSQATIANEKSDEAFWGWGKSLVEMQKYSDAKIALTKACTLNKKHLSDIRNVITQLRQKDLIVWANQYESILPRCGG